MLNFSPEAGVIIQKLRRTERQKQELAECKNQLLHPYMTDSVEVYDRVVDRFEAE